ncbi:sterile alpha motif domain-containing protein 3-like [Onychostoma macrolepis]|uniref:sterile alpha motif domain-containing protein 3-like n=1 Tax=Onychostoma macrolepis TaxID=369639 RepID=UPI00272C3975|nr:sterile alpha motif domain-containing protein 3-like [Onychostoma macrolepis]
MVLERANEIYRKDGTVLTTPNVKSDILEKLAQAIFTYTAYPSSLQIISAAEALIKAHPCLTDQGSFSGLYAWQMSIKYKMANYRTKLRGFGIPEVTCNALKHKHPDDRKSAKNVKKPRRAEVNYLPSYPVGEDEKTLEKEREELVSELKKKNNEEIIKEKMNKTFAHRRHEIINQCPSVQDIKERWPALFQPSQVTAEFQRITTVQLEPKFMSSLDLHTPKLLTLFRAKGGVLGQRLKTEMELLKDEHCSVDMKREVVIRCMTEFLGEHAGDLIKEFNDNEELTGIEPLVMAVIVTRTGASSDSPKDTGIVIEGVKVLKGLEGVPRACCVLLGLTYALNLHYPKHLKYTFEVFQKLLLELDASKLSNRVQSLRSKLLS